MRTRKIAQYCVAALTLPLVAITPRPAQAEPITIGTIFAVVTTAYSYYQKIAPLLGLGPSEPDLAAAITNAKNEILNALVAQEEMDFFTGAQSAMGGFSDLQYRQPSDPFNAGTWNTAIETARTTLLSFEYTVNHNGNVNALWDMAPTYAALLATHAGLRVMKAEIDPSHPSSWHETNERQAAGIQTLNKLVGSPTYMCDPGYNPGAGNYNYTRASQGGSSITYDSPSRSLFWKKLESGMMVAGTWSGYRGHDDGFSCTSTYQTASEYANPVTGEVWSVPGADRCNSFNPDDYSTYYCDCTFPAWPKNDADKAAALDNVRNAAAYYYGTNDTVSLLRTAMKGILSIGGGRYPDDEGSLSKPGYGAMVDPTIIEPACWYTGNLAYPEMDVPAGPEPRAFQTGYVITGDERNIFPDQQVRITNQTAYEKNVARTATFDIPGQGTYRSYTLVLRYNTDADTSDLIAKVGLQSGYNGTTMKVISNNVRFPTTNTNWKVVRLDFDVPAWGWPSSLYARIEYRSGATTYLDAAWLETR